MTVRELITKLIQCELEDEVLLIDFVTQETVNSGSSMGINGKDGKVYLPVSHLRSDRNPC